MQGDLFTNAPEKIVYDIPDGELYLIKEFIPSSIRESYFNQLNEQIHWSQDEITMYGKTYLIPRLQCWYGEKDCEYAYSGVKLKRYDFSPLLLQLKGLVETSVGESFNSVLTNLYRDGSDYASWHSDDELELGNNPKIASLSLGATRRFVLKHNTKQGVEKLTIDLEDGDLLVMGGSLQKNWKHQLNKTQKTVDARINLTFRKVIKGTL